MLTWRADDGHGLEGTRLILAPGHLRALGRLVRPDFTASYRLVLGEDGTVERLSVTSATAQRERHLTLNRSEDGYWLLDTGSGGSRGEFGRAVDIDLDFSPMFNAIPIRRLDLHRQAGEHTLAMVHVSLPDLQVSTVSQTYRTVSVLDDSGHAVVEFRWDELVVELVVDTEGNVISYPGLASRLAPVAEGGILS